MFQATKLLRTFDVKFWKEIRENNSLLKYISISLFTIELYMYLAYICNSKRKLKKLVDIITTSYNSFSYLPQLTMQI